MHANRFIHSFVSVSLPFSGVVGLAAYVYLERTGPKEEEKVVPKNVQEKSPLDPENFVDFTLKRVDSYNHNTAK